jgi:YD repeat-containing protein
MSTASNRVTSSGSSPWSYDGNGNLLSDGVRQFTYDARGRLVSVQAGGNSARYFINADGLRVAKEVRP